MFRNVAPWNGLMVKSLFGAAVFSRFRTAACSSGTAPFCNDEKSVFRYVCYTQSCCIYHCFEPERLQIACHRSWHPYQTKERRHSGSVKNCDSLQDLCDALVSSINKLDTVVNLKSLCKIEDTRHSICESGICQYKLRNIIFEHSHGIPNLSAASSPVDWALSTVTYPDGVTS